MTLLFASFYLVPAIFLGVVILMSMILLKQFGVGYKGRRVWFVLLATVLLTPAVVPAGIIMTAIIPYGLLALMGAPPLLHHPELVKSAGIFFSATALIAILVACFCVKDRQPRALLSFSAAMVRVVVPAAVIVGLLALYYERVPNRMPAHVDRSLVETSYGTQLDAVAATLELEDMDEVRAARSRLRDAFAEDPIVMMVNFADPRLGAEQPATIFLREDRRPSGSSCTGSGRPEARGVMRCTYGGDPYFYGGIRTLQYRRNFTVNETDYSISIDLYYKPFMARHPRP